MIIACVAAVRALFARQQTPRYSPSPRSGRTPLKKALTSGWLTRTRTPESDDATKRSGESYGHEKHSYQLQEQRKGSVPDDSSSQEHILSPAQAVGRGGDDAV